MIQRNNIIYLSLNYDRIFSDHLASEQYDKRYRCHCLNTSITQAKSYIRRQFLIVSLSTLRNQTRLDIPCEMSASRQFTWNIKPYFSKLKKYMAKLNVSYAAFVIGG